MPSKRPVKKTAATKSIPTPPQNRPKRLLTSVQSFYFEVEGQQPQSVNIPGYSRSLAEVEEDQLWERHIKVSEKWASLDYGWVEQCAFVLLRNTEGGQIKTIPTPEQVAENAKKVIEIGFGNKPTPLLYLHPGESQPLSPVDFKSLRIRCKSGVSRVILTAVPG